MTQRADFIDVSHWNTVTDKFAGIKRNGVLGVIIKATDGLGGVDPKFHTHMAWARGQGLLVGAYHFIQPGDAASGAAQADHFLNTIGFTQGLALVLDWEKLKPDGKTPAVSAACAKGFINRIHERTGAWPVVYSYASYLFTQLAHEPLDPWSKCKLWLAGYVNKPTWPSHWWPKWWAWQFTGDGHGQLPHDEPGVGKNIDIDRYNGPREAMAGDWATVKKDREIALGQKA